MKKFLLSLSFLVSLFSFSQIPVTPVGGTAPGFQSFGTASTATHIQGLLYPHVGFILTRYTDTAAANANAYVKWWPGAQIAVGNKVYMRSYPNADSWIDITGSGTSGTVTSVGLSMPSAFTVTNSPVTGAGTLTVTGAGTTAQYIRGDGTLATTPVITNEWHLTGNGGTTAGTNFIGTTDNIPLLMRINNQRSGWLSQTETYFGYKAGNFNIQGGNTAIGDSALLVGWYVDLGTGDTVYSSVRNVAIGNHSLENVGSGAEGSDNIAVGYKAAQSTAGSAYNIAIGTESLQAAGTSSQNVAIGYQVLKGTNNGNNVAIGHQSMILGGGNNNVAIGAGALGLAISSNNNVAIGAGALEDNTASENVAIGAGALKNNTSATYNTAIGTSALQANTGGINTAVGTFALMANTTGISNVAIGVNSMLVKTTGDQNTAVGTGSMEALTTGQENTGVGYDAGLNATTAIRNVWIGWNAKTSTDGLENVAIGYTAGASTTAGNSGNVFIGVNSGFNGSQLGDADNTVAIGANSFTTVDNSVVIGNSSMTQFDFWGALRPNGAAGTSGQVLTSAGVGTSPTWETPSTVATAVPWSGVTASTSSTQIDNGAFTKQLTYNSLGNGSALKLTSTSTAAAANGQIILDIQLSGANANSSQITRGASISNIHTGTGSTNIGLDLTASGAATNNHAVNISGGSIGLNGSAGTSGQVLTSAGANALPTWSTPSSGLTVGTTPIGSGTPFRLLFEGSGNVLQEDDGLTFTPSTNTLQINGPVTNLTLMPKLSLNFDSDADAVQSAFAYDHSNTAWMFDAWYNGSNFVSSSAGSNFAWYKNGDELVGAYNAGTAKGSTFASFNLTGGLRLAANGSVGIGTAPTTKLDVSGRFAVRQGADVASAAGAIALGSDGNSFELTGTAAVTLISNVGWVNGSEVTLLFTSTASLTDGTANSGTDIGLELAGNTNFTGSAGATITLILSEIGGTQRWREKARSVN